MDEKTAASALKGFIPFAEDEEKQERYLRYLRWCLKKSTAAIPMPAILDSKEREEFILSAQIFKPTSSAIAARFESSSRAMLNPSPPVKGGLYRPDKNKQQQSNPNDHLPKQDDNIVIQVKNSAPSRTSFMWIPALLLCKRFNMSPPECSLASFAPGSNQNQHYSRGKEVLSTETVDQFLNLIAIQHEDEIAQSCKEVETAEVVLPVRPSDDLFEEIFGSMSTPAAASSATEASSSHTAAAATVSKRPRAYDFF